jgi:hypothetical protein
MAPNSDGRKMSVRPMLLGATVVMGVLCPTLLCCYYGDALELMGWLTVARVTYIPLLQCMFVVVKDYNSLLRWQANLIVPLCYYIIASTKVCCDFGVLALSCCL